MPESRLRAQFTSQRFGLPCLPCLHQSRQVGHFSKTHRGVSEPFRRLLHCLRSNFRFYKVFRTLLGEFSRNGPTCLDPRVTGLSLARRCCARTAPAAMMLSGVVIYFALAVRWFHISFFLAVFGGPFLETHLGKLETLCRIENCYSNCINVGLCNRFGVFCVAFREIDRRSFSFGDSFLIFVFI